MKKFLYRMLFLYGIAAAYISSHFYTEKLAYRAPVHERRDISALAGQSAYTEEEYEKIFRQTGLGRAAVDSLADKRKLLDYQESYFSLPEYVCKMNSPVSFEERVQDSTILLAPLEDGDILVTNSSHVLSWRNGHAAIVVDAAHGVTLEAVVIGKNSKTQDISKWSRYPNFAVLRLKGADKSERAAIAHTAMDCLCDVPYRVTIGLYPRKYCDPECVRGTQCAHLVWLAYAAHGYDIDSNHGLIVTPKDIFESDLFEVVQVYGMG